MKVVLTEISWSLDTLDINSLDNKILRLFFLIPLKESLKPTFQEWNGHVQKKSVPQVNELLMSQAQNPLKRNMGASCEGKNDCNA
jgi:hypothetical protein